MVKLSKGGAYLINGTEIIEDSQTALAQVAAKTGSNITSEEAAKNTIAYGILKSHNTSDNMDKLKIKFDKMTSHDITFVGIIQTARASGLEKFPIPYVLTNCHNSLLTKMIICLDLHVLRNTAEYMYLHIRPLFTSLQEKCLQKAAR